MIQDIETSSAASLEIIRDIIRFFQTEILNDEAAVLHPNDEIISLGLIDSMGIVRLMTHLQSWYGICELDKRDLTLDNFRSIERIAAMISKYLRQSQQD